MKRVYIQCVVLFLFMATVGLSGNAYGYLSPPAVYTWAPGVPNYNTTAVLHNGTIDLSRLSTFGDFLGITASNPSAGGFGDSGVSVGWDDAWVSGVGNANTNGDGLDGRWVQIYWTGGWWDLGSPFSQVAAFSSQDHGPYLGEGTEYRVFGTNTLWDNGSLGAQATITDIYLDGWRVHNAIEDQNNNGWCSDDVSAVFQLDGSYRYIRIVSWDITGTYSEPEMDGMAGVIPEPTTMLLLASGLIGLGIFRKRFR